MVPIIISLAVLFIGIQLYTGTNIQLGQTSITQGKPTDLILVLFKPAESLALNSTQFLKKVIDAAWYTLHNMVYLFLDEWHLLCVATRIPYPSKRR